jgi:hypothetical protein
MKWFFLGICGLGVLLVIAKMSDGVTSGIHLQSVSAPAANTQEAELRVENRQLKEQIAQLTEEMARLKHTQNNSSSSPHIEKAPQLTSAFIALSEEAKIQSAAHEFTNAFTSGRDPIAALKKNFVNEEVDSSWASMNQRQLETFFKESFTDVLPQYIECRSTRCRITVPVSDQKKVAELAQTLMQGIFNNEKGIAKKIAIEPTANDGTLNFYLARNDEVNLLQ